jgi:hypothetical protein
MRIALLLILLVTSDALGAVTRDAETSSSCSSCSSDSFAHTTPAGSNMAVFFDAAIYDFITGTTISAVTYNGDALTSVDSVSSNDFGVHTYQRVAPDQGSNAAAISLSANVHMVTTARTFAGVDQVSPTGTVVTDSNTNGVALSAGITVAANGMGYDAGAQSISGVCTGVTATGTGQTERYDECNIGGDANSIGGFGSTNSTIGSATHSYTLTAAGGDIAMLAFPINAASAASVSRYRVIVVE